ncbi:chaperone DNAJ protein, putative [Trypanosoma cruzi marinkellei]|uniref:Chaperone DNAJ protein, putative n=1 Tax=Trypanosoma cruzi marinkellei TaxID=85056 RepID=K2PCF7_TRYCR|nr:chaperone DNAJ protein, putative [Trypanosoma cruzi marinkellei]
MVRMEETEEEFQEEGFLHRQAGDGQKKEPDPSGYYAALGVPQNASQSSIRRSFLYLSQAYHTDKHGGESKEIQQLMNERFQQLQEAYMILSDEKQRAAYDAVGSKGVNMVSLLPENITLSKDVARYVTMLEKEQEVLQLENMLSSNSMLKVSYSIAQLFIPDVVNAASSPSASPTPPPHPSLKEKEDGSEDSAPKNMSTAKPARERDEEGGGDDKTVDRSGASSGTNAPNKNAQVSMQNTQMKVQLIRLDGEERLVLVPSPELEGMLRQRMGAVGQTASHVPSVSRPPSSATFMQKLFLAALPQAIFFRNSFKHELKPNLNMQFLTVASHQGPRMHVGCGGKLSYVPDAIRGYEASCQLSLQGMKLKFSRFRELNALWSLKTKLLFLNAWSLLERYEISLYRKLSRVWSLENTLTMSLTENGVLKTSVFRFADGLNKSFSVSMGYGVLAFVLYNGSFITSNDKKKEETGKEKRGFVSQTVSFLPLSGFGRIGFEAWYNTSEWQSIGIGFATDLSLSILPIGYMTRNTRGRATNTISFLYTRKQHRIEIPVAAFISSEFRWVLLWLMTPWVCYRAARVAWYPFQRLRLATIYRQRRLEHRTEMDLARVRVMHEQKAVEVLSLRNRLSEEKIGGLVIINAKYGVLNPRYPESLCSPVKNGAANASQRLPWWRRWQMNLTAFLAGPVTKSTESNIEEDAVASSILVLDVTVPLQNFVRDSQLVLPEGSKSKLVGFTDPDPFTEEEKELKIVYWFQHRRHAVTLTDSEAVELPRREHLMES